MRKEMQKTEQEIDRFFERDIEAFDISPWFRAGPLKKKGSGFTIKIIRSGNQPPRVSVRTFGNVNKENVQKQIREQLGIREKVKEQEKPLAHVAGPAGASEAKPEEKPMQTPRLTEEPHVEVRRLDSKVVVDMKVPGVKSLQDIEIKELESSVEVKAMAGDKAYFKILTKPEQYKLTSKSFDKEVLHLEFS